MTVKPLPSTYRLMELTGNLQTLVITLLTNGLINRLPRTLRGSTLLFHLCQWLGNTTYPAGLLGYWWLHHTKVQLV